MERQGTFSSISQRAAFSYVRLLSECVPGTAEKHALHAFFEALYGALYDHPEAFGLPLTPDDWFVEGQPDGTKHKAELNAKLKRPREAIAGGLGFLRAAGRAGDVEGQALRFPLEILTAYRKKSRAARLFLAGLAGIGLTISEAGDCAVLSSERFAGMMPALKALALACDGAADSNLGAFHFARCDFRAEDPTYTPDPLDLYRAFSPAETARLAALHEYFTGMGYKAITGCRDVWAWMVQYQGRRQVKSTPLFQVEFQERYRNPLMVQLKPAATRRLAQKLLEQPKFLQDDFFQRAYRCRGDECGWCKNRTNLGPTTLEHDGKTESLCWYTYPGIAELNDESMQVIRQYVVLHEALA